MNNRDKAIHADVKRFRVLNRDQIIAIHFSNQKQPIATANRVLNRLTRDGFLKVNKTVRPYEYMLIENKMKFTSSKVNHFRAIANFYVELCKTEKPTVFEVEIKVNHKGAVEPDGFMRWLGNPFFIEIQNSVYSAKIMQEKINRYEVYRSSGDWKELSDKFPILWIQTDTHYSKLQSHFTTFQTKSVEEFVTKYVQKKKPSVS